MRNDRQKALLLRKQGKSYAEITKKLGIPKSTLSGWFKGLDWSDSLRWKLNDRHSFKSDKRRRAAHAVLKKKWNDFYEEAQNEAIKEFPKLKDDPLFVAGLMLYWGEGDKQLRNSQVRLSNSDPELSKIYYDWLVYALKCPKEKITAHLLLYPDLIDEVQKRFWSKATGVPMSQFRASTVIQGKHPNKRLSYGVCIIQHTNRALKEKVMKWLELYPAYAHAKFLALE